MWLHDDQVHVVRWQDAAFSKENPVNWHELDIEIDIELS